VLTNAYYYNAYRPYIVGVRNRNDITVKRSRIAETTPKDKLDQGMMIVLNKAMKNEIVRYAQNVSGGVTNFKSSVRTLLKDMGNFTVNAMYDGYESATRMIEKDIVAVTEAYNKSTAFLAEQQQSGELRSFSNILRDRALQGQDRLGMLGVSIEENTMRFDSEVFRSMSHIELHGAIGANMPVFHSLHKSTTAVLTTPLSSHMHFKGLNYHYNYQLGKMVEDGFGIIESGMIVDRIV